ncbi:hypothetical protein [Streptomyces iakyrus]|uniref:hypothetical protein n=1 Tax=Streptomyces iakyrus TaxID=68219 RepID=UPI003D8BD4CE
MPLLLLDLDNTLVDRDAAFRAAVADFLVEHALPVHDAEWLMTVDAGGYTPRAEVARAVRARYGARAPGPPSAICSTGVRPTASSCPARSAARSPGRSPAAGPW